MSKKNNLLSGRVLAKNVIWNVIGMLAPLVVALVTIPVLINIIGVEKFGVLTIVWMVIGYFSLFDLGLGRTLTKLVAEKLGKDQEEKVPALVWTTIVLMSAVSMIGALLVYSITPWLVLDVLNIPAHLQEEVIASFYWLALSIPFVIMTTAFRGILEAYQFFGWVNAIRLPMGIFTFLGPVAVLPFSAKLDVIVIVLLVGRIISFLAHVVLCFKLLPVLTLQGGLKQKISMPLIPYLLSFGGWMTVTNIIGPLMVYLDRFLIGAVLTLAAVAYYATPYEMITKLWLIPGVVLPVLFPAFSTAQGQGSDKLIKLYSQGMLAVFVPMFPLALVVILFSSEALALWLNAEFAQNSSSVLQILAYGVFINSFAQVSFSLVQGIGRPDLTAKLHLLELPFYLLGLWWLMPQYGIIGVAIVWSVRIALDTIVLFAIVKHLLPGSAALAKVLVKVLIISLIVIIGGSFMSGLLIKIIYLFVSLLCFILLTWHYLLGEQERQWLRSRL